MKVMTGLTAINSGTKDIAKKLQLLLKERHLSENDIAQAINIPLMTVRRIVSGETTDPRVHTLKQIADYLNITVDYLIAEHAPLASKNQNIPTFVPVIDWQTASSNHFLKNLNLASWEDWQPVAVDPHYSFSESVFALESRPSMHPRFPVGTLFIIEPNETPTDGDLVLVKMKKTNELSLRELVVDPPKWQLHAVINGSDSLFYDDSEHEIAGVVILTMLYSRKDRLNK